MEVIVLECITITFLLHRIYISIMWILTPPLTKPYYHPISDFLSGSNLFERIIQNQIADYIKRCWEPFLCGYRKGYNVQHICISLIESRVFFGYGGTILMDLSKVFDTINHNLLIAKLHAYRFDKKNIETYKFIFYKQVTENKRKEFI